MFGNRFDILKRAAHAADAPHRATRLSDLSDLAVRGLGVADAELGDSTEFPSYPRGENLAALFLAEAGAWEVAFGDKGDDVEDKLVLVEDGVDDDRDDGGEVGFSDDFDEDDDESAGLEDGA